MKVLILGDGLLGSELKYQNTFWDVWSRKQGGLDVTMSTRQLSAKLDNYDVVVNCIAHTDTYDTNRDKHWDVNFKFVDKLVWACVLSKVKLVHISTDYVYANSVSNATEESIPVHHESWYGYTKLLADGMVQLRLKDYLLLRCGHKQTPFPHETATTAVIGNFDYVDIIASMISDLILKDSTGVFNVGTDLKSIYDLALHTEPYVKKSTELPIKGMPTNVSMDTSKVSKKMHP